MVLIVGAPKKGTPNFLDVDSGNGAKTSFEFTDPSGTIAHPGMPLNAWLEQAPQVQIQIA